MCLGIPGTVVEVLADGHFARIDVGGADRRACLDLMAPGEVSPGDWVLVHAGLVMQRLDAHEAALALASLHMLGTGLTQEMASLLAPQRNGGATSP
jgi:hydrogenase expression/formation protein HypC